MFLRTAIRYPVGGDPSKEGEVCLKVERQTEDTDPCIATWADGYKIDIEDVLSNELENYSNPRKDKAAVQKVWEGEHATSHHRLFVQKRVDRSLLVSLYEQTRQICQVQVKMFGPEDSEEAFQKAAKLMTEIGETYATGSVGRSDLFKLRDDMIKKCGVNFKRASTKRPSEQAMEVKQTMEEGDGARPVRKRPAVKIEKAANDKAAKSK